MKARFSTLLFLIFLFLSGAFAYAEVNPAAKNKFVVVLDAGHGGHDSGNRGSGYYEKNIALDIILKTGAILEQNPDIKVIYTRKTDVFIPLNKRADIANTAKADLFVSVHCNAHSSSAYGTETFVLGLHANERNFNVAKKENAVILLEDNYQTNYDGYDPNSPESVIGLTLMQEEYLEQSLDLASRIQNNFTKQLKRSNRGVKQAGFLVLHRTFMPSVLVETGFLTNKSEGKYLNSTKGKQAMASAIAKAITLYKKDVSSSYDSVAETPAEIKEEAEVMVTKIEENVPSKVAPILKKETVESGDAVTTKVPDTKAEVAPSAVQFKVQILAGSSKIATNADNFMGLENVTVLEQDSVYKYYYGNAKSYEEAQLAKQKAKEKGYESCFVVAFKNGFRIPISEAVE